MNGKQTRLLKKQAVIMANDTGKDVAQILKGLKKMVKSGVIKFDNENGRK